ncbi:MAG: hypothetical protein ACYDHY_06970 [Acidiferrobacterales bacterium]
MIRHPLLVLLDVAAASLGLTQQAILVRGVWVAKGHSMGIKVTLLLAAADLIGAAAFAIAVALGKNP